MNIRSINMSMPRVKCNKSPLYNHFQTDKIEDKKISFGNAENKYIIAYDLYKLNTEIKQDEAKILKMSSEISNAESELRYKKLSANELLKAYLQRNGTRFSFESDVIKGKNIINKENENINNTQMNLNYDESWLKQKN